MKKGESRGVYMIMKTGMEVTQDYTVFRYGPPRPQKYLNNQDITKVAGTGMKPAPKFVLPVNIKEKVGK